MEEWQRMIFGLISKGEGANMVELFEQDLQSVTRHSSKGNQLKWESNGVWYKADYIGYEGLSEYVISELLKLSSLKKDEFVEYEPIKIKYKDVIFRGVKSDNFLKDDWQIITLERLFKSYYGKSFHSAIYGISGYKERLEFLVSQVENITGLKRFGEYINKLFAIDAIFLNEDRHMHNIAVLMNGIEKFALCPIFDNGAGLLADTKMNYPMQGDLDVMMNNVKARNISTDFDEQLDASEELYGGHISFKFNKKDLAEIVEKAASVYEAEEVKRVEKIVMQQMRRYDYLFA